MHSCHQVVRCHWGGGKKSGIVPTWTGVRPSHPKLRNSIPKAHWRGGGQKFARFPIHGPAVPSLRDFFLVPAISERRWNASVPDSRVFSRRDAGAIAWIGHLFPSTPPPGGGQKSGTFRSGTGGLVRKKMSQNWRKLFLWRHTARKIRREIREGGVGGGQW